MFGGSRGASDRLALYAFRIGLRFCEGLDDLSQRVRGCKCRSNGHGCPDSCKTTWPLAICACAVIGSSDPSRFLLLELLRKTWESGTKHGGDADCPSIKPPENECMSGGLLPGEKTCGRYARSDTTCSRQVDQTMRTVGTLRRPTMIS